VNQYLPQILDALKCVHSQQIWHLDLKPANIMVDKSGAIKLIDFGASKQIRPDGGATTSTALCYTPGYAPNEQTEQSMEKFGPWTDFYALGATLYKLLTNNEPPKPSDIIRLRRGCISFHKGCQHGHARSHSVDDEPQPQSAPAECGGDTKENKRG
jgi:serine/threonine protein kinase